MENEHSKPFFAHQWHQIRALTARQLHTASEWAKATWTRHRDQVSTNPAYATALGAAVSAVVELFTHDPQFLAAVAALIALYVAIHRATHPDPWKGSGGGWRPGDDRWDDGLDWR